MTAAVKASFCARIVQNLELLLQLVNQLCIGFVTFYVSWMCLRKGLVGIFLHAWLVTFGFCFLMAEGMLCHYDANALTFRLQRQGKTIVHLVLLVLGGGMGVAGCLIQLIHDDWQLVTVHARLGFAAFILCLVALLTGLCAFVAKYVGKIVSPLVNKSFHIVLGFGTFVTAMMAQYYGYSATGLFRRYGHDFQTYLQVVTLVMMVLTSIGPLKSLYQKVSTLLS